MQPAGGHEVVWVIRDCLTGEPLLARSLLSGTEADLATLLREVEEALPVPILGVVSDGQRSIGKAVASALPGIPHQLCQFHYLREAARPIYEADRHAKKELKKKVRTVRAVERRGGGGGDTQGAGERRAEGGDAPGAEVIRGYGSAVRSALTDDGRPPLEASGLKLHARLTVIAGGLGRAAAKGGWPPS